jgi:hypothetical protein
MSDGSILQIIPELPGTLDGVSDYALNLARALTARHGLTTVFAVNRETSVQTKEGFQVVSGLGQGGPADALAQQCTHVILHYVNYGYQPRGVPLALVRFSRELRGQLRGRWVTMFHEIYAWGPPWKSEFWLRPLQVKIARELIDLSDVCFVSNTTVEKEIHLYDATKQVRLAPVLSNFGEPELTDFSRTSPRRWTICGGTASILRSLSSFERIHRSIPEPFFPNHLDVIGGQETKSIRALIERVADATPGLSCHYHPNMAVAEASALLAQCSFGWLDYFGKGRMWPGMILKSGVFAAYGAHGVVPVFSHREEVLAVAEDPFPGPWFMTPRTRRFPDPGGLAEVRKEIYSWYWVHAASPCLARFYAEALA